MNLGLIFDVVRFELARSFTLGRILIWCSLIAFPVVLFVLVDQGGAPIQADEWNAFLYFFVAEVLCQLGLLLWATPIVSTEIENQTWIYQSMRKSGRNVVILGKYVTAVIWTFAAALIALTLSQMVVPALGDFRLWCVVCLLAFLSCVAHAAIFVLIGSLVHRRAMVTAVFYTLAIEYGISFIPAFANQFTVNYRLRSLLANWMDWDEQLRESVFIIGNEHPIQHLFLLGLLVIVTLAATLFRIQRAEYPTQQDG